MKVRKTKVCPRCGRRKPFSAYWKNRCMPDGVQVHCKPCVRLTINESIRRHPETAPRSQRNRRDNGKMRLRGYPKGENYVVAHDLDRGFVRQYNGITVRFEGLAALVSKVGF